MYINTLQHLSIPIRVHRIGDPVLDINQQPIIAKGRETVYAVDMLQVDNKLAQSQRPEHVTFFESLTAQLRTYFQVVQEAIPNLREEMWLYFHPLRSLGNAKFKTTGNNTIEMDLGLEISLKLYVFKHVIENADALTSIRNTVIDIIDEHVQTGSVSSTIIANTILAQMPGMVKYVDVMGINGQEELQTLIGVEGDILANLKEQLVLDADGTISTERALTLNFVDVDIE